MAEAVRVFIDGASSGNPGPAGIGAVFLNAQGAVLAELRHFLGETTNNVAEYLALVYALQEALARGWRVLHVKTDSELLARQCEGRYQVRDPVLRLLHGVVMHARSRLAVCTIEHVRRTENTHADRLATQAVKTRTI
jgi:ribonuclease HI